MKYTVYHGTNCKFDKFNNITTDDTNIIHEIWFTNDLTTAKGYAEGRSSDLGGEARVIKAIIEINNSMPEFLKDGIEQIFKYAKKEDELEEYKEMYNNFNGNDIVEFAEYVDSKKDFGDPGFLIQQWGFDGRIQDCMYTVFSPEQIEIIQ